MSILDIIIIIAGILIVGFYAYVKIKKTLQWRKAVKKYVAEGMTLTNAKVKANQEFNFKNKKSKKSDNPSKVVEDELFTE